MPKFVNPEMKKLSRKAGGQITFYTDEKLEEWLKKIPEVHYPLRPKLAADKECYALMVLLWYTGARPSEIAAFEKEQIYPLNDGFTNYAFSVTMVTKKRKDNEYRKIIIPYNELTIKAYQYIFDSAPAGFYFYAFRGGLGFSTYKTKWKTEKVIYVRENGKLSPETMIEEKEKTYECHNTLIRRFTNALTGLPPLYFRHHRFSWMARLGATTAQIKLFKGAKDPRSVEGYLQYSEQQAKESLEFFPKKSRPENTDNILQQ